jgi:hypothetical protein
VASSSLSFERLPSPGRNMPVRQCWLVGIGDTWVAAQVHGCVGRWLVILGISFLPILRALLVVTRNRLINDTIIDANIIPKRLVVVMNLGVVYYLV